jgi:hypothetical protein
MNAIEGEGMPLQVLLVEDSNPDRVVNRPTAIEENITQLASRTFAVGHF